MKKKIRKKNSKIVWNFADILRIIWGFSWFQSGKKVSEFLYLIQLDLEKKKPTNRKFYWFLFFSSPKFCVLFLGWFNFSFFPMTIFFKVFRYFFFFLEVRMIRSGNTFQCPLKKNSLPERWRNWGKEEISVKWPSTRFNLRRLFWEQKNFSEREIQFKFVGIAPPNWKKEARRFLDFFYSILFFALTDDVGFDWPIDLNLPWHSLN